MRLLFLLVRRGKSSVARHYCRVLLVLAVLAGGPARAQTTSINRTGSLADSLRQVLQQPDLEPQKKVLVFDQLCWFMGQEDVGAAKRYGEQGLQLARRIGFQAGELSCLFHLSTAYLSAQEYLRAEQTGQQMLRIIAKAPPKLVYRKTLALSILAEVAEAQRDYVRAVRYRRQALAWAQAHSDTPFSVLESAYSGLAMVYAGQMQSGNTTDSIVALTAYHARRALPVARKDDNPIHEANTLMALVLVAQHRQQPDSAVALARQALALYHKVGAAADEAFGLQLLGQLEMDRGHAAVAASLARQAQQQAHRVQVSAEEVQSYDLLAEALAAQGQGLAAYRAARTARHLRDSLITSDNTQALTRLQVRFDTERKESRIRELTQQQALEHELAARQRQKIWALAGALGTAVLALATVVALAVRLRRSRVQLARQHDALAQARATQDRLYSIIAHDLRSPLTAFTGLADMVRYYRQQGSPEALDELSTEVGQTAERLIGLLDNLLHWAAAQTGELTCRPESLPVAELFAEITGLYSAAAHAREVTLRTALLPANLPPLYADRNMTLTILRNLVSNALKASPPGAVLELAAQQGPAAGTELLVRDAGPGLSPAQLAAAMGQSPMASPPPRRGGTGLGLPLVRRLTELQQGVFRLEAAPGGGTTAHVVLPSAGEIVARPTEMLVPGL
ncbi:MAG: histidine kinase [Hymenobacter sp.]|nr:histidine kinase [Hymenobacter sp.]